MNEASNTQVIIPAGRLEVIPNKVKCAEYNQINRTKKKLADIMKRLKRFRRVEEMT